MTDYKVDITGMLGIEHFELEWDSGTVTEVVGHNETGKSSLCTCLQALLAHDANPNHASATEMKRVYLRVGSAVKPSALLHGDGWITQWEPDKGQMVSSTEPLSSPHALGVYDFVRAPKVTRLIQDALMPPAEYLLDRLEDELAKTLPAEAVKAIRLEIEARGWEYAEGIYKNRALAAGREWEALSGRRRFKLPEKFFTWRPEGWQTAWDSLTLQDAERELQAARDQLLEAQNAVSATIAEIEEAKAAAAQIPEQETKLEKATENADSALGALHQERDALQELRKEEASRQFDQKKAKAEYDGMRDGGGMKCPSCQAELVVSNGELITTDRKDCAGALEAQTKIVTVTGQAIVEILQKISETTEKGTAIREISDGFAEVLIGEKAKLSALEKLAKHADSKEKDVEHDRLVSQYEAEHEDALAKRDLVATKIKCLELAKSIEEDTAYATALGHKGIRANIIKDNIEMFQAVLNNMISITGWDRIELSGDTLLGGPHSLPVKQLSSSQQWRIQAMTQLGIAFCRNKISECVDDHVVVMEDPELLDQGNREAMNRLLQRILTGMPEMSVIICTTGEPNKDTPWKQVPIAQGREI